MKRLTRLIVLLLILLPAMPTAAQETIASIEPFAPDDVAILLAYSPDGRLVAGAPDRGARILCIYAVPSGETVTCVDLRERFIRPNPDDIVWSPDSSRIAFAEDAYVRGDDSDLWIMDVFTGELTNLTDDGYAGTLFSATFAAFDGPVNVDVLPRWSPDGQSLAFARTVFGGRDEPRPTELWTLDLVTGESTRIATVTENEAAAIYFGLAWSPDGETIYATRTGPESSRPDHGIWAYDLRTGATEHLLAASDDPAAGSPAVLNVSPDGGYLSIFYPRLLANFRPGTTVYALYDLAEREIVPLDIPAEINPRGFAVAISPGFNPDGETVLFTVTQAAQPTGAVVLQQLRTGESRVIAQLPDGDRPVPFGRSGFAGGVRFGANGLALVPTVSGAGYLIGTPTPGRRALDLDDIAD